MTNVSIVFFFKDKYYINNVYTYAKHKQKHYNSNVEQGRRK